MSSNVSDEQFRLLCLLHLAEVSMRELLGFFLKNQTLTKRKNKKKTSITTSLTDASVALSEVLDFIPELNEIEKHFHRTSSRIYSAIFTTNLSAASTSTSGHFSVKPTIDFNTFDISTLHYFLAALDLEFLPTRKAIFRKKDGRLSCNDPAHIKKCCLDCQTAGGKLHGRDYSLPCSSCSTSQYSCYNDHTPCCLGCMSCDACAVLSNSTCHNRQVRHAINFLHNVRNLNAHSNTQTYGDLQAGTFVDDDFPGCKSWNLLWQKASDHVLNLFTFMRTNKIIDQTTCITRCDEIKIRLPKKTKSELSQMYPNVLLDLCDEFKRLLVDSEQTVSRLTSAVSSLSGTVSTVSNLEQKVSNLTLPKCFNIKFLLSADLDSCWKMVNDFLGLKQNLSKEDLASGSDFSHQLTTYIETTLTGFLTDNESISVALLEPLKYYSIESGYLYQFVVTPKGGSIIPESWYREIQRDGLFLEERLKRCLQGAIQAEKNVETKIHVYHITFGSVVFTVFIDEASDSLGNVVDLNSAIDLCESEFYHIDAQVTRCKRLENSKYLVVSCDVNLSPAEGSEQFLDVENGISYLKRQVRGPAGAAPRKKRTSPLMKTSKTDLEDEPLEEETRAKIQRLGDKTSVTYEKDLQDISKVLERSGDEIEKTGLNSIELPLPALKNIYLWYHGKLSRKYAAKTIADTVGALISGAAGGFFGGVLAGAGVAIGVPFGPIGAIAGAALGSAIGTYAGKTVTEKLTCKIFDVPPYAALDNAYRYLGVNHYSSDKEINEAYRIRARSTHLDHGGNSEAFLELQYHMGIIKVARGEVF